MGEYSEGMEDLDENFWKVVALILGILFFVVFWRGCMPEICEDRCSHNETQAGYEVCYANCIDID